jgi:hypothetical protein
MESLAQLLNWKLLQGSHDFPSPEGGTCINEAAIIAAGMPYRKVETFADCPPCFCPVLATFALRLNDIAPSDEHRSELMEFVTRLPGSAGPGDTQLRRSRFIIDSLVSEILPIILRRIGLEDAAAYIVCADTPHDAQFCANVAGRKVKRLASAHPSYTDLRVLVCVRRACRSLGVMSDILRDEDALEDILFASGRGPSWAEDNRVHEVWSRLVEILRGAFAIGKQADPLDIADVKSRLDEYRHLREYA